MGAARAMQGRAKAFAVCERAASAVEFAIVGSLLIFTMLFTLLVGLILYVNQALDYATSKAARQVMIGAAQAAGTSQSSFQTLVCSYLPAAVNCANVIVNLYTVVQASGPAGYYSYLNSNQSGLAIPALSNAGASYSLGSQGSYEYLQVLYPITFFPNYFASMFGTVNYGGTRAYLVMSTAAFRNEQY